MAFLQGDDEEWLRAVPTPQENVQSFSRRNKMLRLDDLVADNDFEKKESARKKIAPEELDDDDDEDADGAGKCSQLASLIEKCAAEMGDDSSMRDAPKWGQRAFGAQKEAQQCRFSSADFESIKCLTTAMNSLSPLVSAVTHDNEDDLVLELLTGNWLIPLIVHGRLDSPDLLRCIFNRMAYSKDRNVQRASCRVICDYFMKHKSESSWQPRLTEILEVFRTYGWCFENQPFDGGESECGPPPNFYWLLKCLLAFCKLRLFHTSEVEDLLPVLARCLIDRDLLAYSSFLQDCIEELVNHLSPSSIQKIASAIASVSSELVNVFHVIKMLRGVQTQVEPLRREIAFELLSRMSKQKLNRCAADVISELEVYDPKAIVDFVEVHHRLNLADLWLRNDPTFITGEETFTAWMQILRGFSVKIFCGDYRTFANEVRNRAAFLMSVYGMIT